MVKGAFCALTGRAMFLFRGNVEQLTYQVVSLPFRKEFSTIYFPFPAFFSEIYLDPTHSGYQYTHP